MTVPLGGVDGVPERVVLRLEGHHTPGIHLSCGSESYVDGATFYSFVESVVPLRAEADGVLTAEAGEFVLEMEFTEHLWYFDMAEVTLELWVCSHPDYAPVLCDGWRECPVTEVTGATLVIEPAVGVEQAGWGEIRGFFE